MGKADLEALVVVDIVGEFGRNPLGTRGAHPVPLWHLFDLIVHLK